MSKPYRPDNLPYVLVNNFAVRPELGVALTHVFADMGQDATACKKSIDNGWTAGATSVSGNSHATGHAVDFDHVDRLGVNVVRRLLQALRAHGCEAVLRIKGDDVGASVPIQSCHIHAALRGHGNAAALATVTRPGGKWSDVKQCVRLAQYIRHPW